MKKPFLIITLIVIADQILKFWVKLNMLIGEKINLIGDKINIYFIENEGMAFGMQFSGNYGKLILTCFRIIAVTLLIIVMFKISKNKNYKKGLLICLSLITAGALGNIIDSLFYGIIFSESTPFIYAVLFPKNGGYAPFMFGKVVDMIYCPIISTTWPSWIPFIGGNHLEFFRPIFNIADSSITIGIFWLILGYKKFFPKTDDNKKHNIDEININNSDESQTNNNIKISY